MPTILLATSNKHKIEEIRTILGGRFRCVSLAEFPGAPKVVEDAADFAGNATKKAVSLAEWLRDSGQGKPIDFVLADDSGLEVDALSGAPGVHSARFAALDSGASGNSADSANNAKLLRLMADVPPEERTARFRCVIAFTPVPQTCAQTVSPTCTASEAELQTELFDGACEGRILAAPRGVAGFGYDPLFVPAGFTQTFAELGDEEKNRMSHRAKALAKLARRIS
jgi:XTP/dITP diphosphohydrolase